MRYRKLPVEVEAMLFNEETKQQVYNWVRDKQLNISPSFDDNKNPTLIVPTNEGEMICAIGDYLIQEPFPTDWRKFYPCKPDIFQKTYQPATESYRNQSPGEEAMNNFLKQLESDIEHLPEDPDYGQFVYDLKTRTCKFLAAGYKNKLEEGEVKEAWISVSDKLPAFDIPVNDLSTNTNFVLAAWKGVVHSGFFKKYNRDFIDYKKDEVVFIFELDGTTAKPTHWQPLPTQPNK